MCVRFIENNQVVERFLKLVSVVDMTGMNNLLKINYNEVHTYSNNMFSPGQGLSNTIISELQKCGLDPNNLVGQGN